MKKVEDMTREELIETIRHHEELILRMYIQLSGNDYKEEVFEKPIL